MKKRTLWSLLLIFSLLLAACGSDEAGGKTDDYPNKTIQFIVPWDAGGDSDAINRIIAEELEKELGQTVVVKNIAGASGVIGAQEALTAKPDGYTILAVHDSVTMSELTGQADFGFSDFEPIAMMTSTYDAIATHPDNPWNSMEELVEDAKKNPGKISYAASIGSTSQLDPALIQTASDIEFNIVGFDGTAQRMKAVVGNDVDLGSVSVAAGKDYISSNRMKLLGYAGEERNPELPDVPTLKEQGIDVVTGTNRGVAAPKDTPEEMIKRLSDALEKVANNDSFKNRIEEMGTDVNFKNTEEYTEFIKISEETMKKSLENSGLLKK
ncbi:MAG TPA: tripartite tricarboxylate transporter substrate binding protein [Bacillus bacterium]|uniref:Tripartite tricarboxylate transporter substrate binding protein n=1 Tax=Siminovitchia fordii TaxID=254759 RepID=A0ABQ4K8W4_9BACI|nr:tripartite tricarboxylate transporter substrate binding protein [Siminovitchia fordii]GIN21603.1 hypothetical protein J1TS3_27370 [Siminovitchia fordii]HBZ09891.1 tripartite tricarboxylate transporter substrate binding protein [Bacillus sp. (in: firmicutes)]